MTDEHAAVIEPVEEEVSTEDEIEELSIAEKFIGVFTSTADTFAYLGKRPDFWSIFIVISLVTIGLQVLQAPKTLPVIQSYTIDQMQEGFEKSPMSEAEQDKAIALVNKWFALGTYGSWIITLPLGIALIWFINSLIIFFVGIFMGHQSSIGRVMGIYTWSSLIPVPGLIINSILVMRAKIESMDDLMNMHIMRPFSAISIVPQTAKLPPALETFLAMIDPFFIWSIFVMIIAIQTANNCKRRDAVVITAIVTVLSLAIYVGMAMMQRPK